MQITQGNVAEPCPLCGRDNECRVAKGELYKGPCWCHEIRVPGHILSRLAEDQMDRGCLCRPCLETIARVAGEGSNVDDIVARVLGAISRAS